MVLKNIPKISFLGTPVRFIYILFNTYYISVNIIHKIFLYCTNKTFAVLKYHPVVITFDGTKFCRSKSKV